MAQLEEGDTAPDFTLESGSGKSVSLGDFKGQNVVLYFYPKDDTSGCTKEACGFRDAYQPFGELDAVVLGVSPDSVSSHQKFATKYNLPFELLADTDHQVAEAYGSWVEKSLYGRTYMGVERNTFLIAPDGRIKRIWRKVKPDTHTDEVLAVLSS